MEHAVSYVLPVRWEADLGRAELAGYLRALAGWGAEIVVVDGSPPAVFAANHAAWGPVARHVPVDPARRCRNGKVAGVHTGVALAAHERVVIADDDVRYDAAGLRRAAALLDEADLVRPQNFFDPLPWHARWDTARTLLNRAAGADWPGTLAVRRSRFLGMGGYDGDVLFENLELVRTVEAAGGRTLAPLDLYVRRVPPTSRQFGRQRIRQAYDDFAMPARMAAWLALVPAAAAALARRRPGLVAAGAVAAVAAAERGRRRAGGAAVFPASASLLAPAWLAERGVCAWLALLERARFGGVRYRDAVVPVAAHAPRELRRRLDAPGAPAPAGAAYGHTADAAGVEPAGTGRGAAWRDREQAGGTAGPR
jgi:hypothetical protein